MYYKLIEELARLTSPKQEPLNISDGAECLMKVHVPML